MLSKLINWGILSFFILNVLLITNIETASTLEGRTTEKHQKIGLVLKKNPLLKIMSIKKKSEFS